MNSVLNVCFIFEIVLFATLDELTKRQWDALCDNYHLFAKSQSFIHFEQRSEIFGRYNKAFVIKGNGGVDNQFSSHCTTTNQPTDEFNFEESQSTGETLYLRQELSIVLKARISSFSRLTIVTIIDLIASCSLKLLGDRVISILSPLIEIKGVVTLLTILIER
jgi:hypothetical protein